MTKSTITREQLIKKAQEQIEFCRHTKITGEGRAHVNQCAALFEIALAAMDSEPVAMPDEMTPEMMRAVQLHSELGTYATANMTGAYDLFAEFWRVAYRAATQEVKGE
ncbi:hypothetical protein [Klebsiella pneumoniae]